MTSAVLVRQAASDRIMDNYQSLGIPGLTVAWPNEAGEEGENFFQVFNGPNTPETSDLEGGSDEIISMQVDAVSPSGKFTAVNNQMLMWLEDLFPVGLRLAGATVYLKPFSAGPVPGSADYRVPVTLTFRLIT